MIHGKEKQMSKSGFGVVKDGFKVLRISNRHLVSATTIGESLRYYTNRKNYPKPGNGPLCVFKTLYHASKFVEDLVSARFDFDAGKYVVIYECEYETSRRRKIWTIDDPSGRLLYDLPQDKALAEWVWLVKRVKE
jgi:hypothetical protein